MFLSKSDLNGDSERMPLASAEAVWGGERPASGRPSSAAGRPGSAAGRPQSAGSYEDAVEAAPVSAAALRQKMVTQRQKTLDRQRAAGGGGMVMANQAGVTSRPGTSSGVPPPTPTGAAAVSIASAAPFMSAAAGGLSLDDAEEEAEGAVMPAPTLPSDDEPAPRAAPVPVDPQEEARRRAQLTRELEERGIGVVYDGVGTQPAFDIAAIAQSQTQMKKFLHDPTPKHAGTIQCRITRDRSGLNKLFPKYRLESESGVFLMAAQKQQKNKTANYTLSMSHNQIGKENDAFLGKLRSNFLGLEFVAYGPGMNPKKIDASKMPHGHAVQLAREELAAAQYNSSFFGSQPRGPRKMCVVLPRITPNGERLFCRTLRPETDGLLALQNAGATDRVATFQNKPPKWNESVGAFVLNFNKRVTQASVKNFQLIAVEDQETIVLQFGRVGKETFNMDFCHPLSPFQAFAICLGSFDYKLGCE